MDALSVLVSLVLSTPGWSSSGPVPQVDVDNQNREFQQLWGEEFVWKYDDLPTQGTVPEFRVPYSGYIYPDSIGGTWRSMQKYDQAFHGGRGLAAGYERSDIAAHKQVVTRQVQTPIRIGGWRRGRTMSRTSTVRTAGTPYWHGHCNGWAAASIRHGEPQRSVTKNGVVFSPSDIKGLLAELYTYSDIVDLGGQEYGNVHPGTLHTVLANWLGRHSHPIAMEGTPGREKWNYPIYSFSSSSAKRSGGRQVEVRTNIKYASNINRENDRAPRNSRIRYFHYLLDLDSAGKIVSGFYYRDSSVVDLLWVPRYPAPGGQEGNQQGNPHLKASDVLALWRASVDQDLRDKWATVDPAPGDLGVIARVAETPNAVVTAGFNAVPANASAGDTPGEATSLSGTDGTAPAAATDRP